MCISSNHPREVATPVVGAWHPWRRRPTEAEQFVVGRHIGASIPTGHRSGYVFPTAACQESVVTGGDDLGSVSECDPVRRLYRGPVSQHLGGHIPAVGAASFRSDDAVADGEIGDLPLA